MLKLLTNQLFLCAGLKKRIVQCGSVGACSVQCGSPTVGVWWPNSLLWWGSSNMGPSTPPSPSTLPPFPPLNVSCFNQLGQAKVIIIIYFFSS